MMATVFWEICDAYRVVGTYKHISFYISLVSYPKICFERKMWLGSNNPPAGVRGRLDQTKFKITQEQFLNCAHFDTDNWQFLQIDCFGSWS